ncbi:MAG: nickel pincer cofactor biosynthesis protein LarC [Elusimicrobia bacterium]|nr:nickel pincer cofactor biosynthesis protein LarC [Elusimicrobiota bacterium]
MKTLYLDCSMGAAGNMLTAALYELLDDTEKKDFINQINNIGLSKTVISAEKTEKCGILGTYIDVSVDGIKEENLFVKDERHHHEHSDNHVDKHEHKHTHHHTSFQEIVDIVNSLQISDKIKNNIIAVYKLIAEAESNAHGVSVSEVHFHEVGMMDAIADISAVCILTDKLKIEKIISSPINVGGGHVHCSHGILPVPAPATVFILKNIPVYCGEVKEELCTPTGAALLKYFVTDFTDMPVMKVEKIGYGMGRKNFVYANCLRAMLGSSQQKSDIVELTCNIDDITPEKIGFAMKVLFDAGAVEVYTTNVCMKKSRPGIVLSVMCRQDIEEKIVSLIFKHTTTIGIRRNVSYRYGLNRKIENIETVFGPVRKKVSEGYGVTRTKYEYDDISKIAKEQNLSIDEVIKTIESKVTK